MKKNAATQDNATADTTGLVDALRLLETVFDPESRQSLRWLREQTARRAIPFLKIGHKVFFDPAKVRQSLAKRFTVEAR